MLGIFSRRSSPGDLPDPGLEPASPALQADSLPSEPSGKPLQKVASCLMRREIMSAGWPEPPGGDLGHTHHRRNQGPEGQFDLLPPRTPLGLLAAGHHLCTRLCMETRGGGGRPPVVLLHRYAGSLVPCGYGTHSPSLGSSAAAQPWCPHCLRQGLGTAPRNSQISP